MEREETEEKESVRKTEKERHEMKYKVGDKVRVRRDLEEYGQYGKYGANRNMAELHGSIVEIKKVENEKQRYEINDNLYYWTDEMFEGLAEDELTAEEAIRLKCEMCESISCSECKFSKHNNGEDIFCNKFLKKYPEQVVEIIKQWKKDHEKKEVEVTQKIYCLVVNEERKVVHEEEIGNSDSCMDVLKNYCENHDGKFFSLMEFRYEVKQ